MRSPAGAELKTSTVDARDGLHTDEPTRVVVRYGGGTRVRLATRFRWRCDPMPEKAVREGLLCARAAAAQARSVVSTPDEPTRVFVRYGGGGTRGRSVLVYPRVRAVRLDVRGHSQGRSQRAASESSV